MHNGAHPGQVRPRRQRIAGEITPDKLDALRQTRFRQTSPRHRNDRWKVEQRGLSRRTCAQESNRPGARGPANVQQMAEPERSDCLDNLGGVRRGHVVHGPNEGLLGSVLPAYAGGALGRPARLDDLCQLRPSTQAMRLVLGHGQDAPLASRCQQSLQPGGERIPAAGLREQS